jgi:D-alanyl-D-alanine carboxypeptidase/D-alanyl-D-alanine-endopeptidase (penicillin-binding protein 4)
VAALCASANARASSTAIVTPTLGGTPWTSDDVAKLRTDIDATLDAADTLRGAHVGVIAIDTATGATLYERHADQAFQPASTLKLVVGSAALDILGPTYAPHTIAYLHGDELEVHPDGDPFFGIAEASALAAAARSHPIVQLRDVVVREFPGRSPTYPGGWTFDDFAEDYAARPSDATFEENVVHVFATPGDNERAPLVVRTSPVLPIVASDVDTCTPAGAFLVNLATTGTSGSDETLDAEPTSSGCRLLVGSLASGSAESETDVAVPDPPLYLAQSLVAALRAGGVAVSGTGSVDRRDLRVLSSVSVMVPVWQHDGAPLSTVLPRFWIPSDNFVGETLLLHLARSRDAALEAERGWLRSIGVDPATTTLYDGSGLSQYDRITPRDLVTILQHDWNGPNRQLVLDSLPIGDARGTIEGIAGTAAAGRVFAKTGSMMHVRGLAGYLATERHGAVTFAFEVDDWIGAYPDLAKVRAAVLSRIVQD